MNNLVFGDYCHPINVGERNRLLLSLKEAGIRLCSITSDDMNDDDDYDDYPNILYTTDNQQNTITSVAGGHQHMGNRLSVEEFTVKSGLAPRTTHTGNILKFNFI
jgi:hypothetical protein